MTSLHWNGPKSADWILVLAHGAGAGMESPFMQSLAQSLGQHGILVGRFNFPYMIRATEEGKRRPPDSAKKLLAAWEDVIASLTPKMKPSQRLAIGGKSMGGRIASMSTNHDRVDALVCLGYPFHPPGKPEKLRTGHFGDIRVPAMIVQGERDMFGNKEEVKGMKLPRRIKKCWRADGDHSFKPRKASGITLEQNMDSAVAGIVTFLSNC